MNFQKTKIDNLLVITPQLRHDERGFFARIFCQDEFKKNSINFKITQSNLTLTKKKGTIRGMHFQTEPYGEDKIVQCSKGAIFDVAVDLRKKSRTYLKWISIELNEKNKKMFYVPIGFAHGFQTLTENCEVQYFMSGSYSPAHSGGIRWNDPMINISWPLKKPNLSEKDQNWPLLESI